MSALPLADGPAMFLGGSIMSFALPMAAFIVITGALFYLYRRPHHNPRLKYLAPETVTSVGTWEPGPVPAPAPKAAATAPETVAPETAESQAAPADDAADSASEGKE